MGPPLSTRPDPVLAVQGGLRQETARAQSASVGKIDATCTCIDTSDVKLMEFQSIVA